MTITRRVAAEGDEELEPDMKTQSHHSSPANSTLYNNKVPRAAVDGEGGA